MSRKDIIGFLSVTVHETQINYNKTLCSTKNEVFCSGFKRKTKLFNLLLSALSGAIFYQ